MQVKLAQGMKAEELTLGAHCESHKESIKCSKDPDRIQTQNIDTKYYVDVIS